MAKIRDVPSVPPPPSLSANAVATVPAGPVIGSPAAGQGLKERGMGLIFGLFSRPRFLLHFRAFADKEKE